MRGVLARVGVRGGAAIVLILVILGVLAVAKQAGRGAPAYTFEPPAEPRSTLEPTPGDDAEVPPTPTAFSDDIAVKRQASAFIAAWLNSALGPSEWHARLVPLSTQSLAESLDVVDPARVPATRTTGPPTIVRRTDAFAQVSVAVDTGTVVLNLVRQDKNWRVDAVDWDRP